MAEREDEARREQEARPRRRRRTTLVADQDAFVDVERTPAWIIAHADDPEAWVSRNELGLARVCLSLESRIEELTKRMEENVGGVPTTSAEVDSDRPRGLPCSDPAQPGAEETPPPSCPSPDPPSLRVHPRPEEKEVGEKVEGWAFPQGAGTWDFWRADGEDHTPAYRATLVLQVHHESAGGAGASAPSGIGQASMSVTPSASNNLGDVHGAGPAGVRSPEDDGERAEEIADTVGMMFADDCRDVAVCGAYHGARVALSGSVSALRKSLQQLRTSGALRSAPVQQDRDEEPGGEGLLPCPFCGEKAVLTNVRMSGHSFKVGCYNELCWRPGTDYFTAEDDAVSAWNRRVPLPLGRAVARAVKKAMGYTLLESLGPKVNEP